MNKKTNWTISVIILLSIIGFYFNSKVVISELLFDYGKDYNEVRKSLQFPLIEDNWIQQESSETYSQWGKESKFLDTNEPIHYFKTINLDGDKILSEEDSYHFEFSDTLAHRLIVKSSYLDSSKSYMFIKYFIGKYPPTTSYEITDAQADSVLTKWNIEI